MAESSLSLGFSDFQKEIGKFLGYGSTVANYTTDQKEIIQSAIDRGYRRFLYNARIGDQADTHVWSFLAPLSTLATVAAQEDYDLPDDFASILGRLYYVNADLFRALEEISVGQMQELRAATSTRSGTAQKYAIVAKTSDGTTTTRWQLQLFPNPDGIKTLNFQYNVLVEQLTTTKPFPLGGMNMSEPILESMLAVAEQDVQDEPGLHSQNYQILLSAAVSFDRSENTPQRLGVNTDRSDVEDRNLFIRDRFVKVNGVIP